MPPPTNTTAATATVMTMPYSTVQDVIGATPPYYEVWYTYVPVVADVVMSFWADPGSSAAFGYVPQTDVYTGTASSLTALGITTTKPITITVDPTTQYFFRIRQSGGTPTAALAGISTGRAQNLSSGSGAIGINDDVPDYPLAIYTGTDGTITQYRPNFPAGETAEMLPSGISLWHDRSDDSVLRLYDATLTLVASPSYPHVRNPPITSNRSDTFYVAEPGHAGLSIAPVVSTFSTSGVAGPTTWTLVVGSASILAMAPAHDGTILYYLSSSSGTAIKRWNLTTNTAMSDLAAAVAPYTNMVADLLVLNDGSIIAAYVKNTSTFANVIRRYNASGTLLNSIPYTYPYSGHGIFLHHLTQAIDDPTAFWVWIYQADAATGFVNGLSTFEKRRASDGALLATFDAPQYHAGEYLGTPGTSPTRFGHSDCCPFVTLPPLPPYAPPDTPVPPEPPGPEDLPPYVAPSYDLDARYIRRLRRAPHLDTEHVRIFYKKFELDLERGVGLATGGDPIVMLRLSRDGGHTWSEPVLMGAGRMGEYTKRAIARRLGHARDTVFEVTVSDPVAWSLVGAWLDLESGTS